MWIREEEIMKQVAGIFDNLGIKDKALLDATIGYIKTTTDAKKAYHNHEVGQLKKQHTEIQDKLDRLMDLRLDGEISKQEFELQKNRLRNI